MVYEVNKVKKRLDTGKKSKILQFSSDHGLYFRLAVKRATCKDYLGSLKYIEKAIEKDEFNADYLFNKACILAELKRTRESIKLLNYIIWNIDPTYSECYFGLGCNFFDIGNYEKALHYFEKYMLMEEDGDFCEDAYEILFYMKLPGEAREFDLDAQMNMSEKAQKQYRDSSLKLHAAGSMYLHRGNYKEAIRQFERSIMAYPETKSSRIRLSMAYYMTGQLAMAKLLASSVLKIQKNNHMAKLCLALYYSTEGLTDMSERILSVFARMRGRKNCSAQEDEDNRFYTQMLKTAPVGDEMKTRLYGVTRKLYMIE